MAQIIAQSLEVPCHFAAFVRGNADGLEARHRLLHGGGEAEHVIGTVIGLGSRHLDMVAEWLQARFDMGIGQEVLHDTNLYDRNSQVQPALL